MPQLLNTTESTARLRRAVVSGVLKVPYRDLHAITWVNDDRFVSYHSSSCASVRVGVGALDA